MNSSTLAFLTLLLGLALGFGSGFVLNGSGGRSLVDASEGMRDVEVTRTDTRAKSVARADSLARVGSTSPNTNGGAAKAAAVSPQARSAARRVAARGFDEDSEDASSWTESISGTVTDFEGRPISGATVVSGNDQRNSGRRLYATSSADIGRAYRGFDDLDEDLAENAEYHLAQRRRTRTAQVDESGRFLLEGLRSGAHQLRAFAEGYTFESVTAEVGSLAQIVGVPVHTFELDLRLPDGTQPEQAYIEVAGGNNSWSGLLEWTLEEPTLRVDTTTIEFRAFAGDARRLAYRETLANYASSSTSLDVARDGLGPHRIDLIESNFLRVHLTDDSKLVPVIDPWVRALPAEDLGSDASVWSGRDPVRLEKEERGVFTAKDLAEGSWVVAVGRGTGEPELTAPVAVGPGATELDLVLGDIDLAQFIVVRATVPGGRPALNVRFRLTMIADGGGRNERGVRANDRGMGVYWLARPDANRSGADDVTYTEFVLQATSERFGIVEERIDPDATEVALEFAVPCDATIFVRGDASESYTVGLFMKSSEVENDRFGFSRFPSRGTELKSVDAEGRALYTGLQPGEYSVSVKKGDQGRNRGRNWNGPDLVKEDITLRKGGNEITLTLPALHELDVYAPDLSEGARMTLTPSSEYDPSNPWNGSRPRRARLDSDKRATFEDVPAGAYILQSNGAPGSRTDVTVPSGEVTFEVKKTDSLLVMNVQPGTPAAKAGLENGDVITSVDGKPINGRMAGQLLLAKLTAEDVALEIERGGSALSVTVGKIADDQANAPTFGAWFSPHSR